MTRKAIPILSRDPDGFFLHVEAGRIDHAHHLNNAWRALTDTIELARAVQAAMEMTDMSETLIIVTADHSHGFTLSGYATRGNPILGLVHENDLRGSPMTEPALDGRKRPYTVLGYANGAGFRANGRPDLTEAEATDPDYRQEATVGLVEGTHSAEDVAVYAGGPGAHLFHGTVEQNFIFHVMRWAFGFE
jgi:alkaline phosphatase